MTAKTELEKRNLTTYQSWKPQKATTQLGVWRGKTLMTLPEKASYYKQFTWWLFQKVGFLSTNHHTVSILKRSVKQFQSKPAEELSRTNNKTSTSPKEPPAKPTSVPAASSDASIPFEDPPAPPSPVPASVAVASSSPAPSPTASPSSPAAVLSASQKRLAAPLEDKIRKALANITQFKNVNLKIHRTPDTQELQDQNSKNEKLRGVLDQVLGSLKIVRTREEAEAITNRTKEPAEALTNTRNSLPRTFDAPLKELGLLYVDANKEVK